MWKTQRKRLERRRLFIWQSRGIGQSRHAWIGFLLPSLLGVAVFVLAPFLDVVKRSFLTAVTEEWTGVGNYQTVFVNQAFRLAVSNTLRFTAVCLPMLIGLGLFLAVQLSRLKQMQLIKSMFLFPLAMPAATVVLIWKMLFSEPGFLNSGLSSLGLLPGGEPVDYMGTGAAFWVLVLSYIWKNLGYTIVLWLAGILTVSTDMTEAARVDGAKPWQVDRYITLPLMKNIFGTCVTLASVAMVSQFDIIYMTTKGGPGSSTLNLPIYLYKAATLENNYGKANAVGVIQIVIGISLVLLIQRLFMTKAGEEDGR